MDTETPLCTSRKQLTEVKEADVRRVLAALPATVPELAEMTGLSVADATFAIRRLAWRRQAQRSGDHWVRTSAGNALVAQLPRSEAEPPPSADAGGVVATDPEPEPEPEPDAMVAATGAVTHTLNRYLPDSTAYYEQQGGPWTWGSGHLVRRSGGRTIGVVVTAPSAYLAIVFDEEDRIVHGPRQYPDPGPAMSWVDDRLRGDGWTLADQPPRLDPQPPTLTDPDDDADNVVPIGGDR